MIVLPKSRCGFTLTELLVVIAIIALLLALVLVGFRKAKLMARVARCLSNQRQIALAQASYATDNGGELASPRTSFAYATTAFTLTNLCGSFGFIINNGNSSNESYHSWTASYGANMIMNGTKELETAVTKGRLFPYVGSLPVYKSPLDPTDRLRSYSFNAFVGVTVPTDAAGYGQSWQGWFCSQGVTPRQWVTTHMKHIKVPSQTIMSIVEDDSDGFNFNNEGWVIDPRPALGSIPPVGAPNPAAWANSSGWQGWIDWPAFWAPSNITYSYVDGSTDSYSLQNSNLVSLIQGPPGTGYGHNYPQPADNIASGQWRRDWMHFRDRLLPGVIPLMISRYQQ